MSTPGNAVKPRATHSNIQTAQSSPSLVGSEPTMHNALVSILLSQCISQHTTESAHYTIMPAIVVPKEIFYFTNSTGNFFSHIQQVTSFSPIQQVNFFLTYSTGNFSISPIQQVTFLSYLFNRKLFFVYSKGNISFVPYSTGNISFVPYSTGNISSSHIQQVTSFSPIQQVTSFSPNQQVTFLSCLINR